MKNISICLLLFFASLKTIYAQDKLELEEGKINMVQSYSIKKTLSEYIESQDQQSINGYRVKIHFGANKTAAYKVKSSFVADYEKVPAYVDYNQPYFNVTVGNFNSKLEAFKFLKTIEPSYPSSFLVKAKIALSSE